MQLNSRGHEWYTNLEKMDVQVSSAKSPPTKDDEYRRSVQGNSPGTPSRNNIMKWERLKASCLKLMPKCGACDKGADLGRQGDSQCPPCRNYSDGAAGFLGG